MKKEKLYKINEEGIIVRIDTGKTFPRLKDVVEQISYYGKTSRYVVRKDSKGEYIEWVGFTAKYYDLEEICELMNAIYYHDVDKIAEKHRINNNRRIGHYTKPYFQGRFHFDHTTKKGFWLEDWLIGKVYYFHNKKHIKEIVKLLNNYTKNERFTTHDSKCGQVIEDTLINEEYVLGDSHDIGFIRDFLNNQDYLKYGERKELPYAHML